MQLRSTICSFISICLLSWNWVVHFYLHFYLSGHYYYELWHDIGPQDKDVLSVMPYVMYWNQNSTQVLLGELRGSIGSNFRNMWDLMHWDPKIAVWASNSFTSHIQQKENALLFVPTGLTNRNHTWYKNIGWEDAIQGAASLCPLLFSTSPQENCRSLGHAMGSVVHQYPSLYWQRLRKGRDFWSIPLLFLSYMPHPSCNWKEIKLI